MVSERGGDLGGGGHTSLGPRPNLGLKWEESISLRKQAVNRAALVSKKMSSKILPSSQNIGKLRVWVWVG